MTPDKRADLLALAERVESGSGEDRRIDYEVFTTFAVRDAANFWDPKAGHHYTTSLDSAVALLERVLPGFRWQAGTDEEDGGPNAAVWRWAESPVFQVYAASPARALLAAVLRALATQEGQTT